MTESLEAAYRAGDFTLGGSGGLTVGGPHPFLQAWSWLELLMALCGCLAVLFGVFFLPVLLGDTKQGKRSSADVVEEERPLRCEAPHGTGTSRSSSPGFELHDWKANAFPGSPWNFDHCENLEDVLASIWRSPLDPRLEGGRAELHRRVTRIRLARCVLDRPARTTHFCIIYTLTSGAELFGGAPTDDAIGLSLDEAMNPAEGDDRLRRRRRRTSSELRERKNSEAPQLPLPCLAPFYRVHDGVGVLLSLQHLPRLLESPDDSIDGSCYYIYPVRALEFLDDRRPHLVKFARVDRHCVACADHRREEPNVVYADRGDYLDQGGAAGGAKR